MHVVRICHSVTCLSFLKMNGPGYRLILPCNPYDADVIGYEQTLNYPAYPTRHYSPDDWRRYRSLYFRLVEKVDAEIGKIVDAIVRLGLWKNTVDYFYECHGDGVGAASLESEVGLI